MPADPSQRRSAARTAVVWNALREVLAEAGRAPDGRQPASVVDIGGGTGGFAVRVAELGHRVVVVDPSPDALAILSRRADESGVADLVTGRQGDLADLPDLLPDLVGGQRADRGATWCSATASWRSSTTRPPPWPCSPGCSGPAGPSACWSTSGTPRSSPARWPATSARPGRCSTPTSAPRPADRGGTRRTGHRFTADEITALLDGHGFDTRSMHAVRVFVDLVPSSLVDLEPGAAQALVDLEHAVSTRPEYLALATQIHALATRR